MDHGDKESRAYIWGERERERWNGSVNGDDGGQLAVPVSKRKGKSSAF